VSLIKPTFEQRRSRSGGQVYCCGAPLGGWRLQKRSYGEKGRAGRVTPEFRPQYGKNAKLKIERSEAERRASLGLVSGGAKPDGVFSAAVSKVRSRGRLGGGKKEKKHLKKDNHDITELCDGLGDERGRLL